MSSDAFLQAAEAIGHRIVADAIWHDGRCSWVGVSPDARQAWQTEYRALGPSLYDGTAGVGLFLAQLARLSGDAAIRRTAVGALRQGAAMAPATRLAGFHAGSLGVAWAAGRVAVLLDVDELQATARELALVARPTRDDCPDVLLGTAGSMLARIALGDLFGDPAFVEEAAADGEALLARATTGPRGWSWAATDGRFRRHLCGLSHGAGGIGWALLQLFAVTGDERYRAAADGAFAYERSWLDDDSGTWPDLRIGDRRRRAARPSQTTGSWCHGEAGIAITRLCAIELLGANAYPREAQIAAETTRRRLAAALPYEIEDLTLCHGAAGWADALLCSGRSCDEAFQLGHVALERYGASQRWPTGTLGETTPALFRGTSGIGWWFLRLHDPQVASPLVLPAELTAVPSAT